MAPQPVATIIAMKNPKAKTVFDMTEEWDKIAEDSALMMGCVIVRNEFLEAHPDAVKSFLKEYEASIAAAQKDPAATGQYCEAFGIVPKAAIAEKAIPACGLTFVTGEKMRTGLSGYLKVMADADPKAVGGKLPGEDFYY